MSIFDPLKYTAYGASDIGLVRQHNEDNYLINNEIHLYAVADGLGGLPKGDLASKIAIEELEASVHLLKAGDPIDFPKVFLEITEVVSQVGYEINTDVGIATTLTAGVVQGKKLFVGHVGDSGIFIFGRDNSFRQLTKDHTMAQEMRDHEDFDESTYIPDYFNHTLTRCIGHMPDLTIDTYEYEIEPGDRILFYTDGVTKTIAINELSQMAFQVDSPKLFVDAIISLSNTRGGPDNTTAVALFFE